MALSDPEALRKRARELDGAGLNGLRMVLVTLDLPNNRAQLEVHFHNANGLAAVLTNPNPPSLFPISGGHRLRAGTLVGQVRVTAVAADASVPPDARVLVLTVAPIGDYSTYTLSAQLLDIDPIFAELDFKFRPGCFTTDCAPDFAPGTPRAPAPDIDYLAKDYDSFRHTLMVALAQRVPGFAPASEADFTQVLIDLISAVGDELSDFQDRVMNEAYLGTARKRVSLARHARLMSYFIYQGNQASTWLAMQVSIAGTLPKAFPPPPPPLPPATPPPPSGLMAWNDRPFDALDAVVFAARADVYTDPLVNALTLYTWSGTQPALAAGDTSADLVPATGAFTMSDAQAAQDLFLGADPAKTIARLLIQEHLDPATGKPADADPLKRQILTLTHAQALMDPLTGTWLVRVSWRSEDALQRDYCFVETPGDGTPPVANVSLFHGNLAQLYHGRIRQLGFVPPGASHAGEAELEWADASWGTVCVLPDDAPLQYRPTPRGQTPTQSTLDVLVRPAAGGMEPWREHASLVPFDDNEPGFVVETDEDERSLIRFGNGTYGQQLPDGAIVFARYQLGRGEDGNVGADQLVRTSLAQVTAAWNPFDVTDGSAPEPPEQIVRNVPEAYRAVQERAITLADYVARAEALPGVQRAAASYAWTGSWRTVRLVIDPRGSDTIAPSLLKALQDQLNAVRLIGEDLEIRPPRFVPLTIVVRVCIAGDTWPDDVQAILAQEFSDTFTSDGRPGFFNPDAWTFGQPLYASEIEGRVQAVPGVEHVISVVVRRFDEDTPGRRDFTSVRFDEIVQVHNDPDHMELGSIDFVTVGGRQ